MPPNETVADVKPNVSVAGTALKLGTNPGNALVQASVAPVVSG